MRLAGITVALCLAAPAVADARPVTLGAGLGLTQAKIDADGEPNDTLQVFGRIGLTERVGAQLELMRIEDPSVDIRIATALIVVELGSKHNFVPLMLAGAGIDRASNDWYEAEGTHIEGGLGLEYRAEGGLTLGADLRLGGRSVEVKGDYILLDAGTALIWAPTNMESSEYRSARLYAGVRF
jgi:hypothetical protein